MSTKRKNKPNPVQNHSEQKMVAGEKQISHKKTIVAVVIAGTLLTFFFAFAPTSWWQPEDAGTSVERHHMVGLVAASLTLSALILTNNAAESPYRTVLFVAAGAAAWVTAFITPEVKSLDLALLMLLCLSPLVITLSTVTKPLVPKMTLGNAGTWLFFAGTIMVVLSLVIVGTRMKFLVLGVFVTFFGDPLGIDIATVLVVVMGVGGVGLVLVAMGWAYAKSVGDSQSAALDGWLKWPRRGG